jgi:hypothetical protein
MRAPLISFRSRTLFWCPKTGISGSGNRNQEFRTERTTKLQEMVCGFVWRLMTDAILSTHTSIACQHMQQYLAHGAAAMAASFYLCPPTPARFCPNYAHHFRVMNGWPTKPNLIQDLAQLSVISARGQLYDPVVIDLYKSSRLPLPPLLTHDECATATHHCNTPTLTGHPIAGITPITLGVPSPAT